MSHWEKTRKGGGERGRKHGLPGAGSKRKKPKGKK